MWLLASRALFPYPNSVTTMSKSTPSRSASKSARNAKTAAAARKAPKSPPGKDAPNNFPKLHNAMWPGLVGKGSPGAEPFIDLDTMLDLTAKAEVNGIKFDGVDLFLYDPHISIDIDDDGIKKLAEKITEKGFVVGSVVAPVWFDGSAMGSDQQRANWVTSVRKACRIASASPSRGTTSLTAAASRCGSNSCAAPASFSKTR